MKKDIAQYNQLIIYRETGIKAFWGLLKKLFFKKSSGLLLIGRNVKSTHSKNISVGKNVKFEDYSEIQGLASEPLIFSDNVTIGRNVMIRPSSYYGIDLVQGLTIGENSSIGPDAYVGCAGKITIGKNVMFGPKCSLFAENHNFSDTSVSIKNQGVNQKGITVEDNVWIGSNCITLDGVTVGEGSIIGAGTLVTKDVPSL